MNKVERVTFEVFKDPKDKVLWGVGFFPEYEGSSEKTVREIAQRFRDNRASITVDARNGILSATAAEGKRLAFNLGMDLPEVFKLIVAPSTELALGWYSKLARPDWMAGFCVAGEKYAQILCENPGVSRVRWM